MQQIKQTELHLYPHLMHKSGWRSKGYKIKEGVEVNYWAYQQFTHDIYYLYDESQVEPRRLMSDAEKEAFKRRLKLVCSKCDKTVDSFSELYFEADEKLCFRCHEENRVKLEKAQFEEIQIAKKQQFEAQISKFKACKNFVVVQVETNATHIFKEACRVVVIDTNQKILFDNLIKINGMMTLDATRVNDITDDMLINAKEPAALKDELIGVLKDKVVFVHSADFKFKAISNTFEFDPLSIVSEVVELAETRHSYNYYYEEYYEYNVSLDSLVDEYNVYDFRDESDVSVRKVKKILALLPYLVPKASIEFK